MSARTLSRAVRRRYGAGPLHLAAHLVAFAIVAFAVSRIVTDGGLTQLIALYVVFAVAHDLVFVPAYTGLDRLTRATLARLPRRSARARVPIINHLRAPALISGVLLIIYSPLISRKADYGYFELSGHHIAGFARNWLLITAALFLGSAAVYAARVLRSTRRPAPIGSSSEPAKFSASDRVDPVD